MAASTDISSWSVSQNEITSALANASILFADTIIEEAFQDVYSIKSNCKETKSLKCLYLYLFLLNNYKSGTTSLIDEDTMIAVLTNVEQISKTCCNGL